MNCIVNTPEQIAGPEPRRREAACRPFTVSRAVTQPSPECPRRWGFANGGQRVTRVMNRWTYEEASFAEQRRRRTPYEDPRFEELLASCETSVERCWFCPESSGGKLPHPAPGQRCWTLDPRSQFDGYHILIVFIEHNPLFCTTEAAAVYLRTGEQSAHAALFQIRSSGDGGTAFYLITAVGSSGRLARIDDWSPDLWTCDCW